MRASQRLKAVTRVPRAGRRPRAYLEQNVADRQRDRWTSVWSSTACQLDCP